MARSFLNELISLGNHARASYTCPRARPGDLTEYVNTTFNLYFLIIFSLIFLTSFPGRVPAPALTVPRPRGRFKSPHKQLRTDKTAVGGGGGGGNLRAPSEREEPTQNRSQPAFINNPNRVSLASNQNYFVFAAVVFIVDTRAR